MAANLMGCPAKTRTLTTGGGAACSSALTIYHQAEARPEQRVPPNLLVIAFELGKLGVGYSFFSKGKMP
ncbi:hypothetical protein Tco_1248341 [Tanacetum coccineum]